MIPVDILVFTVSWVNGTDQGGSGIEYYHIRLKENEGEWVDWQVNTSNISALYTGEHGQTYHFEATAIDKAGNVESFSNLTETSTYIDTLTTDMIAPGKPINLLSKGSDPSLWQNFPQFELNWTNPFDENGIAHGYYKLDSPSSSTSDYDGSVGGTPPQTVVINKEGGQNVYLWLEDGRGNVDYHNYDFIECRYDSTLPRGAQASSADTSVTASFLVSWSGATDEGGSGISGRYDIKVRDNQSAWSYWLQDSLCTNAYYLGEQGHTYYFEAAGRDDAKNIEVFTRQPECSTYIGTRLAISLSSLSGEQSDDVSFNYTIYNFENNLTS